MLTTVMYGRNHPRGTNTPLTLTQTVNGSTSNPITFNTAPLPMINTSIGLATLTVAMLIALLIITKTRSAVPHARLREWRWAKREPDFRV